MSKNVESCKILFFKRNPFSKETEKRLKDYGQNIILNKKKKVWILRFLKQFNDTMIIILLVVALLLFFYFSEIFLISLTIMNQIFFSLSCFYITLILSV